MQVAGALTQLVASLVTGATNSGIASQASTGSESFLLPCPEPVHSSLPRVDERSSPGEAYAEMPDVAGLPDMLLAVTKVEESRATVKDAAAKRDKLEGAKDYEKRHNEEEKVGPSAPNVTSAVKGAATCALHASAIKALEDELAESLVAASWRRPTRRSCSSASSAVPRSSPWPGSVTVCNVQRRRILTSTASPNATLTTAPARRTGPRMPCPEAGGRYLF